METDLFLLNEASGCFHDHIKPCTSAAEITFELMTAGAQQRHRVVEFHMTAQRQKILCSLLEFVTADPIKYTTQLL